MAWKQTKFRILGNSTNRSGLISRRLLIIWFTTAGAILYMLPQSISNNFQLTFAHIFRLPLTATRSVSISDNQQLSIDDMVPRAQYQALVNDFNNLEQTLAQQQKLFDSLYGFYNSYINKDIAFIRGNVIPAKANPSRSELTIQVRGTRGLKVGQFVLSSNRSIIGTVSDIFPQIKTATVKLITANDSKIAVKIDGLDSKNVKHIMQGNDNNNTAKIYFVSKEEKIQVGANVFASDEPGFLDAPTIVGEVSKYKQDDEYPLFWDITVKPAWELDKLDEIAVIIMNPPR